jgi:hypothetical protein
MKQCYVLTRMDVLKCFMKIIASNTNELDTSRWDEKALDNLMHDGWRPVREMALGHGCGLILLEKD